MSREQIFWLFIVLGASGFFFACLTPTSSLQEENVPLVVDELFYVKPQISVAQLLEARGYMAREFNLTTQDGYILRITRGTNPLINNGERGLNHKLPILFVHGTTIPSTSFILNSGGVRPKVYDTRGIDMRRMTTGKLSKMLQGDPSVKALPFLAMNFGYEVWILDRRGILGSRGKLGHENRTFVDALRSLPISLLGNAIDAGFKIREKDPRGDRTRASRRRSGKFVNVLDGGPMASEPRAAKLGSTTAQPKRLNLLQALFAFTKLMKRDWQSSKDKIQQFIETFDPGYWSYSVDEQIEFDFPQAIDFILHKTGRAKLHVLGMSVGGGITLLALANQPELANKISKAVLWAPFAKMGQDTAVALFSKLLPILKGYVGPLPFPFILTELETLLSLVCSTENLMESACEVATDLIAGYSGGQAPMRLFFVSSLWRPVSIIEVTHLSQLGRPGGPCKYEFNTRAENIKMYGQPRAPCYDLGQIRLHNITFYAGSRDFLASFSSIESTISEMKVPTELNHINGSGVFFNHAGYFLHEQADRLVILPSLLDFEQSQWAEPNEIAVE